METVTSKIDPVYVANIEEETKKNVFYRDVRPELTTRDTQTVFMSLPVGEPGHIPGELHEKTEQIFRVETGAIKVVYDHNRSTYTVKAGGYITIPRNQWHEIFSLGDESGNPTKLYTIYTPPVHPRGRRQLHRPKNDSD